MKHVNFIGYQKLSIIVTVALLIISFFVIAFVPLKKSLEFTGGFIYEVEPYIGSDMSTEFPGAIIQKTSTDRYVLKFPPSDESHNAISQYARVESSSFISPSFTGKLIQKSIFAVLFSMMAVFLYIFLRFNLYYSFGAIVTIIHDVILSIAFAKLIGVEFGISTIAAILTIVGYSINDTVIIYDKIRSNLGIKSDFLKTINNSINETLPRTIGTSATTLLAIIPVVLFASGEIYNFCVIVSFGIAIGTISSIAVSALFLIPFKSKILGIINIRNNLVNS